MIPGDNYSSPTVPSTDSTQAHEGRANTLPSHPYPAVAAEGKKDNVILPCPASPSTHHQGTGKKG